MKNKERSGKKFSEYLCKYFSRILPFLNTRLGDIEKIMRDSELEKIATGVVLPFLKNPEPYKNHVSSCEKCRETYDAFLKEQSAKTGDPTYSTDEEFLNLSNHKPN